MRHKIIHFGMLILMASPALAIDFTFRDSFSGMKGAFELIFGNQYVMALLVIILIATLMHAILLAGLKRVPIFRDQAGLASKISWSLSLLVVLTLVYRTGSRGVGDFLERVLGPLGLYGGIILGIFLYVSLRKSIRKEFAYILSGIILVGMAGVIGVPILSMVGLIFIVIGLATFGKFGKPSRERLEREEEKEKKAAKAARRESREAEEVEEEGQKVEKDEAQKIAEQKSLMEMFRIAVGRWYKLYEDTITKGTMPPSEGVVHAQMVWFADKIKKFSKLLDYEMEDLDKEMDEAKELGQINEKHAALIKKAELLERDSNDLAEHFDRELAKEEAEEIKMEEQIKKLQKHVNDSKKIQDRNVEQLKMAKEHELDMIRFIWSMMPPQKVFSLEQYLRRIGSGYSKCDELLKFLDRKRKVVEYDMKILDYQLRLTEKIEKLEKKLVREEEETEKRVEEEAKGMEGGETPKLEV